METPVSILPTINATLNSISFLLLIAGYIAIRRKQKKLHIGLMISAVACSALFLTCYLIYHYQYGSVKYTGEGLMRTIYFIILATHIPLAALMVPPILMMLWFAFRQNFERHKKLARWVLPVWLYVSVTGVLIYLMLYVI